MECIDGILAEFLGLSGVPHDSWDEAAESAYLVRRLEQMGLTPVTDSLHNIRADVPATQGDENAPLLILQGHMDMVCAVAPGSGFDPRRDPITPVVENGVLKTDGRSSLGADNGLGNAVVLWLLNQNIPHGPLRLLFTVAEEVGLAGARELNPTWLAGAKYLLNTDGFHLGRMVVSSAGGRRETFRRPLDTTPAVGRYAYEITLDHYPGGHSGDDIDKGRPNPIKLLAERLSALDFPYALAELTGGTGYNVIPTWARAVIVTADAVEGLTAADTVPGRVWTEACKDSTLALLGGLFNGVYAWHREFPGIVSASANLGRVWLEAGQIEVWSFTRCTEPEDAATLEARHLALAEEHGFACAADGYPGWRGDTQNQLARRMSALYRARTGREMEITAVHVGLEPSFFQEKTPALIMVSTGPDILDAHSVDERAPLAGLPTYARLLADTLEELGRETAG